MTESTPASQLGDRIHAARTEHGWSIKQLAITARVSHTVVWRLENGGECAYSKAARIAAALGIPLDETEGTP